MLASAALLNWSPDGRSLAILSGFGAGLPEGVSYLVPLAQGRSLPSFPAGGFKEDDIARLPGARRIEAGTVIPVHGTDSYIFYRSTVQRNLYRIPVP